MQPCSLMHWGSTQNIKLGGGKQTASDSRGVWEQENLGVNILNFTVKPLNIDHSSIQLWDQLNLNISQGFSY